MTTYAVISDLHIDFRNSEIIGQLINHINTNTSDVDYIINAGDTCESFSLRKDFHDELNKPILEVLGNHDYYGHSGGRTLTYIDSLDLVLATLWTNFNNNNTKTRFAAEKQINDFRMINFWGAQRMMESYNETIAFIENKKPKIVVTHFGCHPNSIDEKYKGNILNRYFINNCSKTIKKIKPKFWIHGHTHSPADYVIDDTRIICNPLGYPCENYRNISDYPIVKFKT